MTGMQPLIERLNPDDAERVQALIDERDEWHRLLTAATARAEQAETTLAYSDLIHSGIRTRAEAVAMLQAEQAEAAKQAAYFDRARAIDRADTLEAERDAVYRERAHLVAALAVEYPSVLVDAADVDEDGWKIVYITLSTGQCSWHIAPADLDLFEHVDIVGSQDERAQWDQHTTEEKYQRIREHVAWTADESYQAWADEGKAATYEHDPDEGKDLDYDEPPF